MIELVLNTVKNNNFTTTHLKYFFNNKKKTHTFNVTSTHNA